MTEFSWSGRVDSEARALRNHQVVKVCDLSQFNTDNKNAVTLLGFSSDEGVRRNNGRLGASQAPNLIRKSLANLPANKSKELFDLGNIKCEDGALEAAQTKLGESVAHVLRSNSFLTVLGGGHETLYGHYLGVRKALGKDARLGIINIDAHFDLREEKKATSGTMFNQILSQDEHTQYLAIGIQPLANTQSLFDRAKRYGVNYVLAEDVSHEEKVKQAIEEFKEANDYLILTVCMDVINQSEAPGVSAPAAFGLSSHQVRKIMKWVASTNKLISFDVSEVNPRLDRDEQTSRLAANLIAETLLEI